MTAKRALPSTDDLVGGIASGDRAMLARAITLVESQNSRHRRHAQDVLDRIWPRTGNALRIGMTGVPGVGKSTTIDQLGMNLIAQGHKVAVLAVDPTSQRSGGSILGDKTRMAQLSLDRSAFIRPSPTSGTLGGVARRTRETMALVEAAGFDVVIVETVGVGQSETTVANMVDVFVVLLLPGGGDELQGLKKGVIELADMLAINKADGDGLRRAERTAADYQGAINLLTPRVADWVPPVITLSGLENRNLDKLWSEITRHQAVMQETGMRDRMRADQAVSWMNELLREEIWSRVTARPDVRETFETARNQVRDGTLMPARAVDAVLETAGWPTGQA